MNNKTNWIAIFASVVAAMVIGFLWYGFIFQNQWMVGNGITASEDGLKMFKDGSEMDMSPTPMIFNTIFMVVYAFIISWLIKKANVNTWLGGMMIGFAVGLTHTLNVITGNLFAANPPSLSLVDGSYSLVLFTVIGTIIGALHKN
ncbi:MAG TPA: DUF1761 domain-containing protein [Saprospiraceae bacterium]|nr:DUF1761 domain-containing protein [Saprospiraceae bacterium]HMU05232.1 DUF1761 domain-containing protein [Saprospiraceae bacterium]